MKTSQPTKFHGQDYQQQKNKHRATSETKATSDISRGKKSMLKRNRRGKL